MTKRVRSTKWKPGQSGNPKGRPKSLSLETLTKALDKATAKRKTTIADYIAEACLTDNTVLVQVLRKYMPDLKSIDAKIQAGSPVRLVIDFSKPQTKTKSKPVKTKRRVINEKDGS